MHDQETGQSIEIEPKTTEVGKNVQRLLKKLNCIQKMERKKYILNEYTNKKSQQTNVNHKNFRTEKNSK